MSDIQAGDVVVCVDARRNPRLRSTAVRKGAFYRVVGLRNKPEPHALYGVTVGVFLDGLTGSGGTGAFAVNRFRKIRPADEQFIRTVRECRPVREGQPA